MHRNLATAITVLSILALGACGSSTQHSFAPDLAGWESASGGQEVDGADAETDALVASVTTYAKAMSTHEPRRGGPRFVDYSSDDSVGLLSFADLNEQVESLKNGGAETPLLQEQPAAGKQEGEQDLGELSRQSSNPVGALWMLFTQQDSTILDGSLTDGNRLFHSLLFQPVMPMVLTGDVRFILRPVIPLLKSVETLDMTGSWDRETGLGDIVLFTAFTTGATDAEFAWGVGPTIMFPTATDDALGNEQLAMGPMALGIYLGEKVIAGVIAQTWWKVAGDDDRDSVNLTDIQYILRYRLTPVLSIGMSPNVQYDWDEDELTFPIGLGLDVMTQVGKMPLRLGFEVQYYLDSPDALGQEWNFRFYIIPILPAPEFASKPLL
jgi:hypothetical protein